MLYLDREREVWFGNREIDDVMVENNRWSAFVGVGKVSPARVVPGPSHANQKDIIFVIRAIIYKIIHSTTLLQKC